jgi:hypothetical protein
MDRLPSHYLRSRIKAEPLRAVQEAFVRHAVAGSLNEEMGTALIARLEKIVAPESRNHFLFERANAQAAQQQGKAPRSPDISFPEASLLWAITLGMQARAEDEAFYHGPLWKQFAGIDGVAQNEKETLAFYMANLGINHQTRIAWGPLGSTYYFDPHNQRIVLDLILSLGIGLENSRAVAFHEIGHSELTKGFGPTLERMHAEIEQLQKKGQDSALTPEEYQRMQRLSAESQFRFRIMDEAENNVVDRWTAHHGPRLRQDLAYRRNVSEAVLAEGMMNAVPSNEADDTPENRFTNVKRAIRSVIPFLPITAIFRKRRKAGGNWVCARNESPAVTVACRGWRHLPLCANYAGGRRGLSICSQRPST